MRSKTIFGALLVSVALCSQGFSFELLDRMLGLNGGGCGECNACAKVAPCEPCAKTCAPAACCEKASAGNLLQEVPCRPRSATCSTTSRTCSRPRAASASQWLAAKPKGCCPEPACCGKPVSAQGALLREARAARLAARSLAAARPAASRPAARRCKPKCHKLYRRPVVEMLENLFGTDECCNAAAGCEAGCGCGGTTVPGKAPAAAPAKAPEQAAPLPAAPKADPSASIQSRGIYQASRGLVRN